MGRHRWGYGGAIDIIGHGGGNGMNKAGIEWCDMTWNPITGCLHGCDYCYAVEIVNRFNGYNDSCKIYDSTGKPCGVKHETAMQCGLQVTNLPGITRCYDGLIYPAQIFSLDNPLHKTDSKGVLRTAPYPFGFNPTFHRYRLKDPVKIKTQKNIFVGSMADMFGDWVPDEWIKTIFDAANKAPQHRYIYLTKNPDRYYQLGEGDDAIIPYDGVIGWMGASATTNEQAWTAYQNLNCTWLSIEPIHEDFTQFCDEMMYYEPRTPHYEERVRWEWIVVGAMTGKDAKKYQPKREWISDIVATCRAAGIPVFLKNNLAKIWGEPLIQEFPWEVI
jgi:protein gp37